MLLRYKVGAKLYWFLATTTVDVTVSACHVLSLGAGKDLPTLYVSSKTLHIFRGLFSLWLRTTYVILNK